jgi:transcriptional regulator with XRE-family HTH domain
MMRKDKGLTREQLAEEFGVSKYTVDKWEQEVNHIYRDVEKLLAQRPTNVSLSIDELTGLTERATAAGTTLDQYVTDLLRSYLVKARPSREVISSLARTTRKR